MLCAHMLPLYRNFRSTYSKLSMPEGMVGRNLPGFLPISLSHLKFVRLYEWENK